MTTSPPPDNSKDKSQSQNTYQAPGAKHQKDDLQIHTIDIVNGRRTGWVLGTVPGHTFEAKVYCLHALRPSCELGQSRISKLAVRRTSDDRLVAAFDRGWAQRPATREAKAIVELICHSLADRVYGPIEAHAQKSPTQTNTAKPAFADTSPATPTPGNTQTGWRDTARKLTQKISRALRHRQQNNLSQDT